MIVGSLTPGKRADLTVVALPDRDAADPHELLFDSEEPVAACYCGSAEAYRWGNNDLNRYASSIQGWR